MANTTTVLAGRDLGTTIRYPVGHNLAARIYGEDGAGMSHPYYNSRMLAFYAYICRLYCRRVRRFTWLL
ncbi:hypothetical protein MKX03_021583 [Papaver bracteatum]|nr:hypothetical protein MKX03_021583 [Papaver bracteatum]